MDGNLWRLNCHIRSKATLHKEQFSTLLKQCSTSRRMTYFSFIMETGWNLGTAFRKGRIERHLERHYSEGKSEKYERKFWWLYLEIIYSFAKLHSLLQVRNGAIKAALCQSKHLQKQNWKYISMLKKNDLRLLVFCFFKLYDVQKRNTNWVCFYKNNGIC